MDEQLTVFAPGSYARLGNHEIRINGFRCVGEGVEYLAIWWAGSTRYETWVQAGEVSELSDTPPRKKKIGYAPPTFPRLAS